MLNCIFYHSLVKTNTSDTWKFCFSDKCLPYHMRYCFKLSLIIL